MRRSDWIVPALVAGAWLALMVASPAMGADAVRGRALYELRCMSCHAESVHGRTNRVAKDVDAVRAWVMRWNEHLRLRWTEEEIDDVTLYLSTTYYRYSTLGRLGPDPFSLYSR